MRDFEKEEFWKALGRLYDASVAQQRSIEALAEIARTHEKRLDKTEVTVEAILEDLKRHREGRS